MVSMDIIENNDEFLEIFIVNSITVEMATKVTDDYLPNAICVINKDYVDESYPFEELGDILLQNGFQDDGTVIYNTNEKCVLEFEDIYYIITRNLISENNIEKTKIYEYIIMPSRIII